METLRGSDGALIDWDAIEENGRRWCRQPYLVTLGVGCTCEPAPHWKCLGSLGRGPTEGTTELGFHVHYHHDSACPHRKYQMAALN